MRPVSNNCRKPKTLTDLLSTYMYIIKQLSIYDTQYSNIVRIDAKTPPIFGLSSLGPS